jgi:hypothetical protein
MHLVSGGMDMTVRKYFTCLIIQYSNMTAAPSNSGQHWMQVRKAPMGTL